MACECAWNHLWSYVHKEVLAGGHLVFNKAGFFKFLRFIFLIHHCILNSLNIKKIPQEISFTYLLESLYLDAIYIHIYFLISVFSFSLWWLAC